MKRRALYGTVLAFSLFSGFAPARAEETPSSDLTEQRAQQKDECLLVARNCGTAAISIQDKIERLKEEIAKGRAVYSREELTNLNNKLEEANKTLDFLLEK